MDAARSEQVQRRFSCRRPSSRPPSPPPVRGVSLRGVSVRGVSTRGAFPLSPAPLRGPSPVGEEDGGAPPPVSPPPPGVPPVDAAMAGEDSDVDSSTVMAGGTVRAKRPQPFRKVRRSSPAISAKRSSCCIGLPSCPARSGQNAAGVREGQMRGRLMPGRIDHWSEGFFHARKARSAKGRASRTPLGNGQSPVGRAPRSPMPTVPEAMASMRSSDVFAARRTLSSSSMRGSRSRSAI